MPSVDQPDFSILTHVSKRSKHASGLAIDSNDGTRRFLVFLVAPWLPRGSGLASAVPHAPRRRPGRERFIYRYFDYIEKENDQESWASGSAPPGS